METSEADRDIFQKRKPGGKLTFLNMPEQIMAIIALGSNQGDAQENVLRAIERLRGISIRPLLKSSLWETSPVDCPPNSPQFVNAIVGLIPNEKESPESLLQRLQQLEIEYGRQPKQVLNEPRPLDLDLIAFGDQVRATPQLALPHPRAHLRRFVLEPLAEICPNLVLPGQNKSVKQLLDDLPSVAVDVRRL
jgi:2-amino-4-hydroxy-6-hydroxymethyldihydropteridine diphosphokinase